MKQSKQWRARWLAMVGGLLMAGAAVADTTIATFDDDFFMSGLFAWSDAIVVSTSTNYSITDTGYGSGYKDINPNIDATGETTIELTVTLSGTAGPNDPVSGPIVSLVDGDGTFYNYAWYGQTNGTHVLTAALNAPTYTSGAGSVPGLDLSKLDFFHLQDDPGAYQGQYTITFENLRLIGAPHPKITEQSYNPDTHEFSLVWTSLPGKSYSILHGNSLTNIVEPLATDLLSGGAATTNSVTVPPGEVGYLRIQQQ